MEIVWRVSLMASCLHAAEAVSRGQTLANPRLAQAVAAPADDVQRVMETAGWPAWSLWRQLHAHAADCENSKELAEISVRKAVGRSQTTATYDLAESLAGLKHSVRQAFPKLEEEMRLRLRPLQEHWESRGPGLLRGIARRTDERVLVDRAEVVLVLPALGGGGAAELTTNRVRIEAVLTNAHPLFPEPLRLGWLLAQLALDLPIFADSIPGERLPKVAALAMIPPALAAGRDVEWTGERPDLIPAALSVWGWSSADAASFGEIVQNWWDTFQAVPTEWGVALTALDRMLP